MPTQIVDKKSSRGLNGSSTSAYATAHAASGGSSDTGEVGQVFYETHPVSNEDLNPDGAGDETNIESVTGAATHWEAVNNSNDASLIYESFDDPQVWARDLYTLSDTVETITSPDYISNVRIYAKCVGDYGSDLLKFALKISGTVYESPEQTVGTTMAWYYYDWATNPATGGAWTTAAINAMQAGISLKCGGSQTQVSCYQLYIRFTYVRYSYWWQIWRPGFIWDTSFLSNNAGIVSAYISLYFHTVYESSSYDIHVVTSSDLADPLVNADYGDLVASTTSYGSIASSALVANDWNNITLNADGLTKISKTGVTILALRSSRDISETDPDIGAELDYSEYARFWDNSTYMPRLVIQYTMPFVPQVQLV